MADDFKYEKVWQRIQDLMITSKHYTKRDKNEIAAQAPSFSNAVYLKNLKDNKANEILQGIKMQLNFYYLVGIYGWDTAVATMKIGEAKTLRLPFIPKDMTLYVGSNAITRSCDKGVRRPYRKKKKNLS